MSYVSDFDRYLITHHDDDFSIYFELVYENYSEDFYNNIGEFESSKQEFKWIERLYFKNKDPKLAAQIIERIYKLFKTK